MLDCGEAMGWSDGVVLWMNIADLICMLMMVVVLKRL